MTAPAPIDEVAFRTKVAEGLGSQALADEFQCSRASVNRRAVKLGVELIGNQKAIIQSIERQVADMRAPEAVEFLLEVVRQIAPGLDRDVLSEVVQHGFTATEAQILVSIFSGKMISRDGLYNVIYGSRASGERAIPKVIDVYMCKIRAKLKKKNWPVSIKTVYCRGYYGERENGFKLPWEQDE